MKIVFISDTHGKHYTDRLPEGDMIVHAGDISKRGLPHEVDAFLEWFSDLPYTHKVFVGGNHDFLLENNPRQFRKIIPSNCVYLEDEGTEIEGIKIWGSPVSPWFFDWAFNRQRGWEIRTHWEKIPNDTDILITHGPPAGILDKTFKGDKVGCQDLMETVSKIQPKIHVFGHIHEAYGQMEYDGTLFLNASVLNLRYNWVNEPIVVDWRNLIS